MIKINKVYPKSNETGHYIYWDIEDDGRPKELYWGGVSDKYKDYLVTDRADAALIGILYYAMYTGQDIQCSELAPVSSEILNNVRGFIMPVLLHNCKGLHQIKISALPTSELQDNAGMIGASLSCGVDSFFTIMSHHESNHPSTDVTHLCQNDVGNFDECYGDWISRARVKDALYKRSKLASAELRLPLIQTESNFAQEFLPVSASRTRIGPLQSVFSIFNMGKAWKRYYYSTGEVQNVERIDEMLDHIEYCLIECLSTRSLQIIPDGKYITREAKINYIADYKVPQIYLHVCTSGEDNCGVCDKCKKTLIAIDAHHKLDRFANVFKLEEYKSNRTEYLTWLYNKWIEQPDKYEEFYEVIQNDPEFKDICERFEAFVAELKQHDVIIYGYGDAGKRYKKILGDRVIAIIDNYVKENGVVTFAKFVDEHPTIGDNVEFVVTSVGHYDEMKRNILDAYPNARVQYGATSR